MGESNTPKQEITLPPFEVKLATPNDAEIICDIRDQAWLDTYPNEEMGITVEDVRINAQGQNGEFVPRRIAWLKGKISDGDDNWIAYVGKDDNDIRGFVIASTDDKGRKFVNSLYVKPGFQGKGLGKQLMQQALNWLGDKDDIYLEVASYNDDAIRFYERFGFVKTDNDTEEESDRPDYVTPIPQIEMVLRASE